MRQTHASKYLFQKTGFEKTLRILYNNFADNTSGITEKEFFKLFLKETYYNAYYRVKKQMIQAGLIQVDNKEIKLTEKGKEVYLLVERLIRTVEGK